MPTLILDPMPAELEALLDRRRAAGADTHDEIWEGVLHMGPAPPRRHAKLQADVWRVIGPLADEAGLDVLGEFNLGEPDDFRVPDGGLALPGPDSLYLTTAALVLEVVSPGDETRQKLPFYAGRHVAEVLIVDPEARTVEWLALAGSGEYAEVDRSRLIDLSAADLASRVSWPPADPS